MFRVGAIYAYSFLWSREKAAGEESGRKDRPVCLLVRPLELPDLLFLFPITSRRPEEGRHARSIPEVECRRGGIRPPAWIILDEINVAQESRPYDFVSLSPLGEFSPAYRREILAVAKAAIQADS